MTGPAAPFSCAASHTNPVSFGVRRPSARGPFISHGQPPGHPSAPGGASGGAELSLQDVCSHRRWGWKSDCGQGPRRHLLPSTSLSHHCILGFKLRDNGETNRLHRFLSVKGCEDGRWAAATGQKHHQEKGLG